MDTLEQARVRYRIRSVRWGFYWAMWCAVLWGLWYVPGTAIWYEEPFASITAAGGREEFLLVAAIITTLSSFAVLLFLFIWTGVLEKWGEIGRTFRQAKITKWFFIAAVFGGPCALFGSFLAIGFVGPIFAAIAALMYPVIGAPMALLWYNENISARAATGIFIILVGGVSIYAPGLLGEFNSPDGDAWIGYLGGLMAAVGWGVEGAIAGRILDVSDPDVGNTIRFAAECLYWVLLILPAMSWITGIDVMPIILNAFSFWSMVWILLSGACFAFCYAAWYKSFPLIGVGRGQAIGALYAVFAVIFLAIFTLDFPEWYFLVGLILTVFGGFLMFTERTEMLEVIRS